MAASGNGSRPALGAAGYLVWRMLRGRGSAPGVERADPVEKQPIVTEEIEVGERQVQDTEQISREVRPEEARVQRAGYVDSRGTDTDGPQP